MERKQKGQDFPGPFAKSDIHRDVGRSGETRTHGLCVPNATRYQLRYTPICGRKLHVAAVHVNHCDIRRVFFL